MGDILEQEGEECAFTLCFEGFDAQASDEYTVAKCFQITVVNSALSFLGNGQTDTAYVPDVSSKLPENNGYSMSAWFRPRKQAEPATKNSTLLKFTSSREIKEPVGTGTDEGLDIRAAVYWLEGEGGLGSVGYFDDYRGGVMTKVRAPPDPTYVTLHLCIPIGLLSGHRDNRSVGLRCLHQNSLVDGMYPSVCRAGWWRVVLFYGAM